MGQRLNDPDASADARKHTRNVTGREAETYRQTDGDGRKLSDVISELHLNIRLLFIGEMAALDLITQTAFKVHILQYLISQP